MVTMLSTVPTMGTDFPPQQVEGRPRGVSPHSWPCKRGEGTLPRQRGQAGRGLGGGRGDRGPDIQRGVGPQCSG